MNYQNKMLESALKGDHIHLDTQTRLMKVCKPTYGDGCALILNENVYKGDTVTWECNGMQRAALVHKIKNV